MRLVWILPFLLTGAWARSAVEGTGTQSRSAFAAEVARLRDDSDGQDWPGYGRTYGEQHYSPLNQINAQNIGQLKLAWYMELGIGNPATIPVAVNGVIYFAEAPRCLMNVA
jgi:quinohemoprotein ethanol dehydrogenase